MRDELTDLEISIKIAEIKNLDFKIENLFIKRRAGTSRVFIPFVPLGFDCNCKLRDEFDVEVDYMNGRVMINTKPDCDGDYCCLSLINFERKADINKAVCLAIIEAHPVNKGDKK